ncbi:MAG: double-strand break repair helicase AddA [Rhodospirillales bacterium]|nr:double-strand break repair helicase AddA [Rhodospirillales bacterium]
MNGAQNHRVPHGQMTAADPTHSAWVSANAGTGKTRVLIDRISRLLLAGTKAERILCLTFTKAAAAEMANRLSSQLGDWAVMAEGELAETLRRLLARHPGGETLAKARRLFAETLETPGGLGIRTIHSFCESLLARFPLEAGVAPHFSVIDERTAAELRIEARDRVLARSFDGDSHRLGAALEHLAGQVDENGFADLMRELDANRGRLRGLLRQHGGRAGLLRAARAALGLDPDDSRETVLAAAAAAGHDEDLRRASAALDHGTAKDRERAAAIRAWLDGGALQRAAGFLEAYAPVFIKKTDGGPCAEKNLITKAAKTADPGALGILLDEQARVLAVKDRLKALEVACSTDALLHLGAALLDSYESMKEDRALLDYDDLIAKARDLLAAEGGASWVHYKLDGGIDHILVDEAQDTSPEQWQVIAVIAGEFFAGEGSREGPRTVFAVGDEKQSIFSFQGADPDEFDRMRAHFADRVGDAGGKWRPVDLTLSYRSTWTVLNFVDRVFETAEARDGMSSGEAQIRHLSARDGQAGLVELWPTLKPEEDPAADPWDAPLDQMPAASPPARLANRIARRIEGWLQNEEILESTGRPIRPGDIMILVRTRGRFAEQMVSCLKQRRIPVAGSDRMVLTGQLAVMDLVALGQFALLPEDDLNLAVVLKSPFFGFDDEALFDLAYGRAGSLWMELKKNRDQRPLYDTACGKLAAMLEMADFTPPFEFFSDLLGRGGGRQRLLARLGPDAEDPIDEFLALALDFERQHVASLQGFLHWLAAGETVIKRDLEHGRGEVRVMTVHGAKGLQSNIVFLPDTRTVPDSRLDPRLLWGKGADSYLLWPVRKENEEAQCRRLREEARRRVVGEYHRLLYVAMTRAKDRLYICGWDGKRRRGPGCWYDLLETAIAAANPNDVETFLSDSGETGWRLRDEQTAPPDQSSPMAETAAAASALPAWARQPAPPEAEPPRPLTPSAPLKEEPPVISPFSDDGGAKFKRGRLTHRLLQCLPDVSGDFRFEAARTYLARPAHDLSLEEQAEIAAEVLAILGHADFAALFGPGSRAEVSLIGDVSGTVISAQIDRLLVTDRAVSVIDYKTNRLPPAAVDEVPAIYLAQMAAYRAALRRIYPDRPVRCLLLWTANADLMALPEPLLDRYAP